jgi:hypothetical protein
LPGQVKPQNVQRCAALPGKAKTSASYNDAWRANVIVLRWCWQTHLASDDIGPEKSLQKRRIVRHIQVVRREPLSGTPFSSRARARPDIARARSTKIRPDPKTSTAGQTVPELLRDANIGLLDNAAYTGQFRKVDIRLGNRLQAPKEGIFFQNLVSAFRHYGHHEAKWFG